MKYRVIVFDFDGVIVSHSEFFKDEAWGVVFAPHQGRYESHLQAGKSQFGVGRGGDRHDIMRHVYTQLGIAAADIPALVAAGSVLFNQHVQAKVLAAGVVEGGREVLAELSQRSALYVNSGTSEPAVVESVEALGLTPLFRRVYGGPADKVDNFRRIADRERVPPTAILFVGDGQGDVDAARRFGCSFVGVANEHNGWMEQPFPLVRQLSELLRYVA